MQRKLCKTYQPEQSISNKDKVSLVGVLVPDYGVHASYLEVGGYELQAVVYSAQVRLLKLHAYMLSNEVNGYNILFPATLFDVIYEQMLVVADDMRASADYCIVHLL